MPFKDPAKAKEYNRKKKLEYYHREPSKFNKLRAKYKKTRATKEKQKEYSSRWYKKKKTKMILEMAKLGELKEFRCQAPRCSIVWKALPNDKTEFCSFCANARSVQRWIKHDRELEAKKPAK